MLEAESLLDLADRHRQTEGRRRLDYRVLLDLLIFLEAPKFLVPKSSAAPHRSGVAEVALEAGPLLPQECEALLEPRIGAFGHLVANSRLQPVQHSSRKLCPCTSQVVCGYEEVNICRQQRRLALSISLEAKSEDLACSIGAAEDVVLRLCCKRVDFPCAMRRRLNSLDEGTPKVAATALPPDKGQVVDQGQRARLRHLFEQLLVLLLRSLHVGRRERHLRELVTLRGHQSQSEVTGQESLDRAAQARRGLFTLTAQIQPLCKVMPQLRMVGAPQGRLLEQQCNSGLQVLAVQSQRVRLLELQDPSPFFEQLGLLDSSLGRDRHRQSGVVHAVAQTL
mmetsp:Transcript_42909/g.135203  ORF Transcript_42909/g.135203 Transcript_42909/m.135203 type:complete len:337 (-) Transcript_42909:1085-2095(-)